MAGLRRALVALAAALALADASIVALALPPILSEMDTTITGVAAVVGVYALVLALGILPAARFEPRQAGFWGLVLFALASLGCGFAGSLELLLVFRALQAIGGAAALLAAFAVLDAGASRHGRRLWLGAALIGTAAGPAIGGALTEAFDWRAIFIVQAPLALAAAFACRGAVVEEAGEASREKAAPAPRDTRPAWGGEPRREQDATTPPDAKPAEAGLWSRGEAVPAGATPSLSAPVSTQDTARVTEIDVGPPRRASAPRAPLDWSGVSVPSMAALAFTAASFTAVLFLLVIELVAGFAISPLRAALGVSVLPVAALAAAAIPGPPRAKALAGSVLLAGGAAALAFLPAAGIAWTIVPQVLAGAGMGLSLPAFSGELLPERTVGEAARNLVARHAGIVVVLAILAPVATAKLESTTDRAIYQGAALVLDAQIDPLRKLELAPALLEDVDVDSPRAELQDAVERRRGDFQGAEAAVYGRLGTRLDDVIVVAVQDAFQLVYLIAAALALAAAALLIGAWRRPAVLAAGAIAAATVLVYAVERGNQAPPPVPLQDPCRERTLPPTSGLSGAIQTEALRVLDRAACRFGSSREEFALAVVDPDRAAEFEREHGVNPRDLGGLLSILGG
jgi:MFS family permease